MVSKFGFINTWDMADEDQILIGEQVLHVDDDVFLLEISPS